MNKDEFDIYNKIADSAAREISESRSFYSTMFSKTLNTLLIIFGIAGAIFIFLFGRTYIEVKNTVSEVKESVSKEISAQVEKEFDKDEIKKIVQKVAEEQTKKAVLEVAPPMIAKELKGLTEGTCSPTAKVGTVTLSWSSIMSGCSSIVPTAVIYTKEDTIINLPKPRTGKTATIYVIYGGKHKISWTGGGSTHWPVGTEPEKTEDIGMMKIFVCGSIDSANTYCMKSPPFMMQPRATN